MKSVKIGPLRRLRLGYWELFETGIGGRIWKEPPIEQIGDDESEHKPIIAYIEGVAEEDIKIESIEYNHVFSFFEYYYRIKGEHTDFVCSICKKNIDEKAKEVVHIESEKPKIIWGDITKLCRAFGYEG